MQLIEATTRLYKGTGVGQCLTLHATDNKGLEPYVYSNRVPAIALNKDQHQQSAKWQPHSQPREIKQKPLPKNMHFNA